MLTETISLLEVFTALLLIVGLLVTGRALYLVLGDLSRLKRKTDYVRNGVRHLQAKSHIRSEARKFSSIGVFSIAIGVLMTYPQRDDNWLHPASLSVLIAILWTITLMIADTLLYLLEREKIIDMLDEAAQKRAERAIDQVNTMSIVRVHEGGKGTLHVPVEIERED